MEAPHDPAGAFVPEESYSLRRREEFIAVLAAAPAALRDAVAGLSEDQLETRYRNWTVRQIVHHVADSHASSYIRFKIALTEERPSIKANDEGRWASLEDSSKGDVRAPLALLEGLHARWVQLLRSMTGEQFARSFVQPETGQNIRLDAALCYEAWHGRHHTAQICWLREQRGW
jgi:uncharacterized damage-inducible protein DinB